MENKELIRKVFHLLFEDVHLDRNVISQYFSKDYIQSVNGETFGFDDFISHVFKVRKTLASCRISFKTLLSEGNIVFSNHIVKAVMNNGKPVRQQVLAEFKIIDGKIIHCDEVICTLDGDAGVNNLGSIR